MFTYRKVCPNVYLRSGVPMFALRKGCREILISESGFTMCCSNVYLEKGVSQSTLGKHFSIPGILANRSINPCLTYNIHILLLLLNYFKSSWGCYGLLLLLLLCLLLLLLLFFFRCFFFVVVVVVVVVVVFYLYIHPKVDKRSIAGVWKGQEEKYCVNITKYFSEQKHFKK